MSIQNLEFKEGHGSFETFCSIKDGVFIVGLSLDNSYFSQENIEKILSWCDRLDWVTQIIVMIPDEPHIHTLVASGVPIKKAIQKAQLKANALENKCQRIKTKTKLTILRWKDIRYEKEYIFGLIVFQNLFAQNDRFRVDCLKITHDVLLSRGIDSSSEEQLLIGVQFLLEELTFIMFSSMILSRHTCYVYHKDIKILSDLLYGTYYLPFNPEVFSIILS